MPRSDKETESQRADREAVERFTSTPEFKARAEQRRRDQEARIASDPVLAQRVAAYRAAAAPILAELREAGIEDPRHLAGPFGDRFGYVYGLPSREYKIAEPIILRWLEKNTNDSVAFQLSSVLARKDASPEVARVMVRELRRWRDEIDPTDLVLQSLAGVLIKVITEEVAEEVCELAGDPNFGSARAHLAWALGKVKTPRAVPVLLKLLDEPGVVATYAAKALGMRKEPAGRDRIEKLLSHPEREVRKIAQKALSQIDAGLNRPGEAGS